MMNNEFDVLLEASVAAEVEKTRTERIDDQAHAAFGVASRRAWDARAALNAWIAAAHRPADVE